MVRPDQLSLLAVTAPMTGSPLASEEEQANEEENQTEPWFFLQKLFSP